MTHKTSSNNQSACHGESVRVSWWVSARVVVSQCACRGESVRVLWWVSASVVVRVQSLESSANLCVLGGVAVTVFFMVRSKQLRISIHPIAGVVFGFYEIYSDFNETVSVWWRERLHETGRGLVLFRWPIVDSSIHINGSTSTIIKWKGFTWATR